MPMIVKIMHGDDTPDNDPQKGFCLYYGVKSFHTITEYDDYGKAANALLLWIADDVKTATVPGFAEHDKRVIVEGNVYIMNESGKTISTWTPPIVKCPTRGHSAPRFDRDKQKTEFPNFG